MPHSTNRWKTSSWYLLVLICIPLFFATSMVDVFNTPKALLFIAMSSGVLTHFLLGRKRDKSSNVEITNKNLKFLLLGIISGITFSSMVSDTTIARMFWGYPGRANGLFFYYTLFVMVWVGANITTDLKFAKKLRLSLHIAFLANIIYALVQFFGKDPMSWANPYDPILGTFGNPNFAAAFLGLAAIYYAWLALTFSGLIRLVMLVVFTLSSALSIATNSIQGPATLFIGLLLMGLHWIRHHASRLMFSLSVVFSVLGAIAAFLLFLGIGPLGNYFYQYTLVLRINYWWIGIKTALKWPLTGVGTDSYVEGFKLLRGPEFIKSYGWTLTSDSAHSVPINFLANYGFINFLLMVTLIAWISIQAVKNLNSVREINNPTILLSVLWVCLLVQSLFSIEQIGISVFQWLIGALVLNPFVKNSLSGIENSEDSKKRATKGIPKVKSNLIQEFRSEISLISVIFTCILITPVIREELNIRRLISLDVANSYSEETLTKIGNKLTYISKDEVRRGSRYLETLFRFGKLSDAQSFLRNMVKKDPQAIDAWESLARIEKHYGNLENEIEIRRTIETLDPYDVQNILDLAITLRDSGNFVESSLKANRVLLIAPNSVEAESATSLLERDRSK